MINDDVIYDNIMLLINNIFMITNQNLDKSLIPNLQKLGLSEKEASVYVYLMARDNEVGSSKIILATGLHGQYVYNALSSLETFGLIKHVVKNGRKKWSANPPHRLESLIEGKRMIANQVKDALELLSKKDGSQEFEVYQGEEQFLANEFQMLKEASTGSTICVIAGKGDRFSEILNEDRRKYNALGLSKDISVRYIGTRDQLDYLRWVKTKRPNFDFRIMPGLHTSSVSTSIHEDSILFQIYGNPLLVFKLKSKQIAIDYQSFFSSLWNLCETVE